MDDNQIQKLDFIGWNESTWSKNKHKCGTESSSAGSKPISFIDFSHSINPDHKDFFWLFSFFTLRWIVIQCFCVSLFSSLTHFLHKLETILRTQVQREQSWASSSLNHTSIQRNVRQLHGTNSAKLNLTAKINFTVHEQINRADKRPLYASDEVLFGSSRFDTSHLWELDDIVVQCSSF